MQRQQRAPCALTNNSTPFSNRKSTVPIWSCCRPPPPPRAAAHQRISRAVSAARHSRPPSRPTRTRPLRVAAPVPVGAKRERRCHVITAPAAVPTCARRSPSVVTRITPFPHGCDRNTHPVFVRRLRGRSGCANATFPVRHVAGTVRWAPETGGSWAVAPFLVGSSEGGRGGAGEAVVRGRRGVESR